MSEYNGSFTFNTIEDITALTDIKALPENL